MSGFGDLGSEEQPFLLEFNRQQNGLFTLVMYVSGAAALSERTEEGKMRSTFIYKDIPAEKLNTEFFCCLYRYQSDKKVTYTFKDLLRGPFSQFGNPAIAKENGSIIAHETPGVWGILNEWMAKWHSLRNGDFRDQLKLNMRLKALVTLWHSDPQNVRVKQGAALILSEAAALHKKGALLPSQMKAVKATVKEVNENFLSQKEEEMPQIFPPAMVALAKSASLVLGGSEALRELLLDSLGSEAWESVDQLVQTVNREAVSAPLVVLKTDEAEVAKPQRLWRKKLEAIGTAWRITRLALTAIFSPMTAVAWMVTGAVLSRFGGPLL